MGKKSLKERYEEMNRKSSRLWYVKDSQALEELELAGSFKAKSGDNYLAFLPQKDKGADYFMEIFVHFNLGTGNDAFLCPKKMGYGKKCPVCDYQAELQKAGEPKDVYRKFYPTRRLLFFVLDMTDSSSMKKGVQLYDAPYTIMENIIEQSEEGRSGEIIDISDPEEGFNLQFRRRGEKQNNTKYTGFKRETRNKPIPEKYLDLVPSFEDVLIEPDIAAMEEALSVDPYDDDEDEKEPPRRARKVVDDSDDDSPRSSKKRRDDDADEEEDEKPRSRKSKKEEDDEEEEEKPRRAAKRKPVVEDDEEEDEKPRSRGRGKKDDDDDEDERPSRRSSRLRSKDDDDDEDEKPSRGRGKKKEEEDDDVPFDRGKKKVDDDDDDDDEEEETDKKRANARSNMRRRKR